jgi:hypothetical protein
MNHRWCSPLEDALFSLEEGQFGTMGGSTNPDLRPFLFVPIFFIGQDGEKMTSLEKTFLILALT